MKRFALFLLSGLLVLVTAGALLYSAAPYLINTRLLPPLMAKHGIDGMTLDLFTITPWSVSGSISFEDNGPRAFSLQRFQLRYSPTELAAGKLQVLTLSGVTIRLEYRDGRLQLPHPLLQQSTSSGKTTSTLQIPPLPVMVPRIELKDAFVVIDRPGLPSVSLSMDGKVLLDCEEQQPNSYVLSSIEASMKTGGVIPARLTAAIDLQGQQTKAKLDLDIESLAGLPALLPNELPVSIDGSVNILGLLTLEDKGAAQFTIKSRIESPDLLLRSATLALASSPETPLIIDVSGNEELLHFHLRQLNIIQPENTAIALDGKFDLPAKTVKASGTASIELLAEPVNINLSATQHADRLEAELILSGQKQQARVGDQNISAGKHSLSVNLLHTADSTSMEQSFKIASLALPGHEVTLQGVRSLMSYEFTASDVHLVKPGRFTVRQIRHKGEDLAGLETTIRQDETGLNFSGTAKTHLATPLLLRFHGKAGTQAPVTVNFNLEKSAFDLHALPSTVTLPPGLTFSGTISASGSFSLDASGPKGTAEMHLADGLLAMEEKKVSLTGISGDLVFPRLPELLSSPGQLFTIDFMDIGNLRFTDGRIHFRIEDSRTVFIEKSRFTWCNGKVESGSLRFSLDNPELSTILYCDRLQFSELLGQLGISDADGDGSLNGRLPLHFTGKEMTFDDGFLFSTPGNSGIVRFKNTAVLRQNMPDMGQAAHLEYSLQAIENFSYNWTKLTFNSQGEDLLISMQLDGKPAEPLPFGYKGGQLVRKVKGSGIQHPVRLDVNFHLPFMQMFKYGQNLQKIMENLQ